MMSWITKCTVEARREDHDDSLAAAAGAYAEEHGLEAWEVAAAWVDGAGGERDEIAISVREEV